MNTIIEGLKGQFGDDVVVDSTNKDFVRLSYTGPNVKAWEASAESCTGCGQNCLQLCALKHVAKLLCRSK